MGRPKKEAIPEDRLVWERFVNARTVHNVHGRQSTVTVEEQCGVRHSLIEDAENPGLNPPRAIDYMTVAKLAEHYGVSVGYLAGTEDKPTLDVGNRATQEYTGLSEGAVDKLRSMNGRLLNVWSSVDGDYVLPLLSRLLESGSCLKFLEHVAAIDRAISTVRETSDAAVEKQFSTREEADDFHVRMRREYNELRLARFEVSQALNEILEEMFDLTSVDNQFSEADDAVLRKRLSPKLTISGGNENGKHQ